MTALDPVYIGPAEACRIQPGAFRVLHDAVVKGHLGAFTVGPFRHARPRPGIFCHSERSEESTRGANICFIRRLFINLTRKDIEHSCSNEIRVIFKEAGLCPRNRNSSPKVDYCSCLLRYTRIVFAWTQ